jgi:hypothetical protein
MADERLRALEQTWRRTGVPTDGATLLRARVKAGALTQNQINTAAYLGDEPSQLAMEHNLYDQTGEYNDHICGICPCGWCRWEGGYSTWLTGLTEWSHHLPFAGIDEKNAEQEMLIRMGRALAEAVWNKLYTPEEPFGSYVIADARVEQFLQDRAPETRSVCRDLWVNAERYKLPNWSHQVLYHVLDSAHRFALTRQWFRLSGHLLGGPCKDCDASEGWSEGCAHCMSERQWRNPILARDIVQAALIPWVLSEPTAEPAA